MKKFIIAGCLFFFSLLGYSQSITLPPSGDNQKCSVTQWIGLVSVNITYSSPDVAGPNGEDRKGKIWGGVVPFGLAENNFGTAKKMPWRAGANENTTITFSHNVKVGGSTLPAGTYSIHMIPSPQKWVIIFSRDVGSWGSYFYDEKNDALRIEVTPVQGAYTEWLTYDFIEKMPSYTMAALRWENLVIPFKIEADVIDIYLTKIREELKSAPGFDWRNWVAATNFCITQMVNLQEALLWADYAIDAPFVGERNFETLTAKANVLIMLNRQNEADVIITEAMDDPSASIVKIHNYGRQLITAGQTKKAMDIFELNSKKFPDDRFTTIVGLARGYEALGKKKQAARHYRMAAENAPEGQKEYYLNLANSLE